MSRDKVLIMTVIDVTGIKKFNYKNLDFNLRMPQGAHQLMKREKLRNCLCA